MSIRRLDENTINQIAAGEVIERPASAAKELIENAIDAGATHIEISTVNGGKSLLRVIDDGHAMNADELQLAVSRHCTSKLDAGLTAISSLGFRGEALPSIGSVSKLTLKSRLHEAGSAASQISVTGGAVEPVRPSSCNPGTTVEVADLFYATPARLKFMKSDRAENTAISDVVKRIALAFPAIGFVLSGPDRQTLQYRACGADADGQAERIAQVLGQEFIDNCVVFDTQREGVRVGGYVSLPSYNRSNATQQYALVNGRPIRDKQVLGALRGAYSDMLARDRHSVAVLFIETDPRDVDVNVHPAKADVRFRDAGLVRSLIVGGIRRCLSEAGIRPTTDASDRLMRAFEAPQPGPDQQMTFTKQATYEPQSDRSLHASPISGFSEPSQTGFEPSASPPEIVKAASTDHPLGAARAQIDNTYIVAQTDDSLVLVDQHAAHERLVYEALKQALDSQKKLPSQMLLVPDIVNLPQDDVGRLMAQSEELSRFGLLLDQFGEDAVSVAGTPAMLGDCDVATLVKDIADDLADSGESVRLRDAIERVASSMACHGSVRAGRSLKPDEMNALLRQMEATPGSGTCNHGRPTYISLKLSDIERMFGRR